MRSRKTSVIGTALIALLLAAACSSDDGGGVAASGQTSAAASEGRTPAGAPAAGSELATGQPETTPDCDCSCEAYADFSSRTEEMREAWTGSGAISPELRRAATCATRCAAPWSRCERSESAGSPEDEEQLANTIPKSRLTPEYLEGEWCGAYRRVGDDGPGERTRYVFAADGSYRVGPPGNRHELVISREYEDFFASEEEKLVELEDDRFRVVIRNVRTLTEHVFRRGPC